MRKFLLIASIVFLTVVATARNCDNGCAYSPPNAPTIEAVQLDACQADVLSIDMNVCYNAMPVYAFYCYDVTVVYYDCQRLAVVYTDTGATFSYAMPRNSCNTTDNTEACRHRPSDIMIRQVQAA